ncbi:hypothetical protein ACP275_14G047100 [Erythranthe tilingii]
MPDLKVWMLSGVLKLSLLPLLLRSDVLVWLVLLLSFMCLVSKIGLCDGCIRAISISVVPQEDTECLCLLASKLQGTSIQLFMHFK